MYDSFYKNDMSLFSVVISTVYSGKKNSINLYQLVIHFSFQQNEKEYNNTARR